MAKIFLYGVQGQYGNYCAALRAAGLEPVLSRDLYRSFDCAGLLLPGGGDIGAALDGTDQFLIESFTETRRPVLGICRGMQAINVYFGGTLHRWIPGHQQPQGDLLHATRTVGPLTALLGPEPDGTAECIRHGTLPVWGVQWHPERQSYALRRPDAADGAAVFEAFAAQVEQE